MSDSLICFKNSSEIHMLTLQSYTIPFPLFCNTSKNYLHVDLYSTDILPTQLFKAVTIFLSYQKQVKIVEKQLSGIPYLMGFSYLI